MCSEADHDLFNISIAELTLLIQCILGTYPYSQLFTHAVLFSLGKSRGSNVIDIQSENIDRSCVYIGLFWINKHTKNGRKKTK